MQNEIMDAVTRKLFALFGGGYAIYTGSVEQELEEPCFFVAFLEPSNKPLLGRRYRRIYDMSIQYFPQEKRQPARELNEVADRLLDGMEYVRLADGSMRRGTGMKSHTSDGVLTFFVTYDMFGTKPAPEVETMGSFCMKGASG